MSILPQAARQRNTLFCVGRVVDHEPQIYCSGKPFPIPQGRLVCYCGRVKDGWGAPYRACPTCIDFLSEPVLVEIPQRALAEV